MAKWPYNTSQWAALRQVKLAAQPLCYACELRGKVVMAMAVDHIKPISKGGDPFPPLSGLTGLCQRCHNEKTSGYDNRHTANGRRFKGIDVNGNPIDPNDAWHGPIGLSKGVSLGGGASNHGDDMGQGPTTQSPVDLLDANHSQKVVI